MLKKEINRYHVFNKSLDVIKKLVNQTKMLNNDKFYKKITLKIMNISRDILINFKKCIKER